MNERDKLMRKDKCNRKHHRWTQVSGLIKVISIQQWEQTETWRQQKGEGPLADSPAPRSPRTLLWESLKERNTSKAPYLLAGETHHRTYDGSHSVSCLDLKYKLTVQPPDSWGNIDMNTNIKGTPSKQRQYRQVRVPKLVINILRSWINSRMPLNKT